MAKQKIVPSNPPVALAHEALMGRDFSDAVVFFHEAIAAHLGINATEWKCLGLLERQGPLPASRLAELSGFTTGAITGIVDRLERAGYVRREKHPTYRRSVIVQPVKPEEGRKRVEPVFQSLVQALSSIASKYSPAEISAIASYLTQITAAIHAETARLKQAKTRPIRPHRAGPLLRPGP